MCNSGAAPIPTVSLETLRRTGVPPPSRPQIFDGSGRDSCANPSPRKPICAPAREEVARPRTLGVNTEVAAARAQSRPEALVVEDDPDARRLVAASLRRLGLRVLEAATAKEALSLLATTVPDVICLDLRLPDESGFAVCEQVRRSTRLQDVPVLVISALGRPLERAQAHAAGADDYLTKPFRAAALAESIRELLALSAVAAS